MLHEKYFAITQEIFPLSVFLINLWLGKQDKEIDFL